MKKLTDSRRQSIEFDRRCLADLDLKMPRQSAKYLEAVFVLANMFETSPYFFHIDAARKGHAVLYRELRDLGYTWDVQKQEWVTDV
jgi:hypothetical protein